MKEKSALFGERLEELKARRLAILLEDLETSQRAIVFGPALKIDAQLVNLAIRLSANNLFVALSPQRTAAFMLSPMSRPSMAVGLHTSQRNELNMCVSVEAREGVTTGISAADRAHTIRALGEQIPNPRMLVKPGHIFPVEVREGGVLVNHALPEGALDIVKIASFTDAALFSDILNEQGELARVGEVLEIARQHSLPVFRLSEITQYRLQNEVLIERMAEAKLPTRDAGEMRAIIYKSRIHEGEHLALVKGEISSAQATLTRIQLEQTFTDVFGGSSPPSRSQIQASLQALNKRGNGVLIYLRRPFRGVLKNQLESFNKKSEPAASSMIREYGIGSQILLDLGVRKIELLTNSPRDYSGVKSFGIEIVNQTHLSDGNV